MAKYIEQFKSWADTFPADVDALKAVVASNGADNEARRMAAGALGYLVQRMDLIPDWNPGIGVIDDLMVMRVASFLATNGHALGELPAAAEVGVSRMANDADRIAEFLGAGAYDKLKAYCARLSETAVRGRKPADIVDNLEARTALYAEIEDELKKSVPIVVDNPADAELRLKAYLQHKLG